MMDGKDRRIIRALQEDGRITNVELAAKVNLSPSPCLRRLRMLENEGVITGYRAVVDAAAYGLPLTVFVRVRLERHSAADARLFEQHVVQITGVMECYCLTGAMDYQLTVLVSDMNALEAFIRNDILSISGIAAIETSISFSIIKRSAVFPVVE